MREMRGEGERRETREGEGREMEKIGEQEGGEKDKRRIRARKKSRKRR